MIPCDPAIQAPSDGRGAVVGGSRSGAKEFSKISAKDAARFVQIDDQLKKLARYFQLSFFVASAGNRHLHDEGLDRPVPCWQTISWHFECRDFAACFVPHWQSRRISRSQLRVREDEDDASPTTSTASMVAPTNRARLSACFFISSAEESMNSRAFTGT